VESVLFVQQVRVYYIDQELLMLLHRCRALCYASCSLTRWHHFAA